MTDIDYEDRGSILKPLRALGFLGRPAVTVPLKPRDASENYRGFHVNDWSLCVGCSTCQKVCDNAAISMVKIPELPEDPVKGLRNERPAIDYGRCCWCGLCVDICPTGSLALSREYVHHCREEELDSYFILPDPNGMHQETYPKGWAKTEDADLLDLQRQAMDELPCVQRVDTFTEIVEGYTPDQALIEASRCVQCGMCHDACPTHMQAPEYIRAIWEGDLEQAVREIYRTNPLARVCGRVCTHRCETACSIGRRGEPVAIRWLKRYAMDSLPDDRIREIVLELKPNYLSSRKIAIVGSGPAGLTAAFDLAKQGIDVTIYEAQQEAGGMMRYGIPEYRLPYDHLDADIAAISALGVNIIYNTRIGIDISMADLQHNHDAVVLAIGLQNGRSTRIPGSDHRQVVSAVELLRWQSAGQFLDIPQRAVVIGGGNVAMDAARTLARRQQQEYAQVNVTVCALEDLEHMLADPEEIDEAREEGVTILDSRGPCECVVDEYDKLVALKTYGVISVFDDEGRFAPRYNQDNAQFHDADLIIEAIGQMSDTNILGEELTERLEWYRGRLKVTPDGRTSEPWLWAAGDMVNGPDVVHAIADGHRVASSIDTCLVAEETPA